MFFPCPTHNPHENINRLTSHMPILTMNDYNIMHATMESACFYSTFIQLGTIPLYNYGVTITWLRYILTQNDSIYKVYFLFFNDIYNNFDIIT